MQHDAIAVSGFGGVYALHRLRDGTGRIFPNDHCPTSASYNKASR